MLKAALNLCLKLIAVLVPFLAPYFLSASLATYFGITTTGIAPKTVELGIQAGLSSVVLIGLFTVDLFDIYLPREDQRKFGAKYFSDIIMKSFREQLDGEPVQLTRDLRVNVMFARRSWRLCLLGKRFHWFANDGFDPKEGTHRDAHLWLTCRQGLCGRAFCREVTATADLRNLKRSTGWRGLFGLIGCNEFRMLWWQVKRTAHVKAIVSVPIYKERRPQPAPAWVAVGVINIDAVSEVGADWLVKNQERVARFFGDFGSILAYLG